MQVKDGQGSLPGNLELIYKHLKDALLTIDNLNIAGMSILTKQELGFY